MPLNSNLKSVLSTQTGRSFQGLRGSLSHYLLPVLPWDWIWDFLHCNGPSTLYCQTIVISEIIPILTVWLSEFCPSPELSLTKSKDVSYLQTLLYAEYIHTTTELCPSTQLRTSYFDMQCFSFCSWFLNVLRLVHNWSHDNYQILTTLCIQPLSQNLRCLLVQNEICQAMKIFKMRNCKEIHR